ncbi:MAG: flippase-like domain-containing protein, partial [Verrucomicrobiae bacterium]|nr:flippase-like domain-containing protein [Verrucomicrobiae bacterium]
MAKTGAKLPKLLWRIALCAVLLGWVFHQIFLGEGRLVWERDGGVWESLGRTEQWRVAWTRGPEELLGVITHIRAGPLLLSLVFMGLTIFVGAVRWRIVMRVQGLNLPFGRAAEISLVAHFFNSFLLGSAGGDLIKAYYAARETHHLKTEAVATVFIDRFLGLLSMLAFASVMMVVNLRLVAVHGRLQVLAGSTIVLLLAGLVVG